MSEALQLSTPMSTETSDPSVDEEELGCFFASQAVCDPVDQQKVCWSVADAFVRDDACQEGLTLEVDPVPFVWNFGTAGETPATDPGLRLSSSEVWSVNPRGSVARSSPSAPSLPMLGANPNEYFPRAQPLSEEVGLYWFEENSQTGKIPQEERWTVSEQLPPFLPSRLARELENPDLEEEPPGTDDGHGLLAEGQSCRTIEPVSPRMTPLLHASLGGVSSLPQGHFYDALPPQPQQMEFSQAPRRASGLMSNSFMCRKFHSGRLENVIPSPIISSCSSTVSGRVCQNRLEGGSLTERPMAMDFIEDEETSELATSPSIRLCDSPTLFGAPGSFVRFSPSGVFQPQPAATPATMTRSSISGRLSPSDCTSSSGGVGSSKIQSEPFGLTKTPSMTAASGAALRYKKAPTKGWWKTEICKFWRDGGGCRNEGNCRWAHGLSELRTWEGMEQDAPNQINDLHLNTTPLTATPPLTEPQEFKFFSAENLNPGFDNASSNVGLRFTTISAIPPLAHPSARFHTDRISPYTFEDSPLLNSITARVESFDLSHVSPSINPSEEFAFPNITTPKTKFNLNANPAARELQLGVQPGDVWIVFPLMCYSKQKRILLLEELWEATKITTKEILPSGFESLAINILIKKPPGLQISGSYWKSVVAVFKNAKDLQQSKKKCSLCGSSETGNLANTNASRQIHAILLDDDIPPVAGAPSNHPISQRMIHHLQLDCCQKCFAICHEKSQEILDSDEWALVADSSSNETNVLEWNLRIAIVLRHLEEGAWHLLSETVDILTGEGMDKNLTGSTALCRHQQKLARAALLMKFIMNRTAASLYVIEVVPKVSLIEWMVVAEQPLMFAALLHCQFPFLLSPTTAALKQKFPVSAEIPSTVAARLAIGCTHKGPLKRAGGSLLVEKKVSRAGPVAEENAVVGERSSPVE